MKYPVKSLTRTVLVGVLFMFLVGCVGTEPSRYYLLSPVASESGMQPSPGGPCASLSIGPVRLPEYTNRPQIVTRSTQNELLRAQFDLWAEPLTDTFSRVLAENFTRLLCTKNVTLFLWNSSTPVDYRVAMEVMKMDGTLGKEAVLEAWWDILSGKDSKIFASKQSRLTEPVKNQSYEALVQAHSRALESLSREIAQTIINLIKEGLPQQ
jgi:uncharacterized protein